MSASPSTVRECRDWAGHRIGPGRRGRPVMSGSEIPGRVAPVANWVAARASRATPARTGWRRSIANEPEVQVRPLLATVDERLQPLESSAFGVARRRDIEAL